MRTITTIGLDIAGRSLSTLPVHRGALAPQKRTWLRAKRVSAWCQNQTSHRHSIVSTTQINVQVARRAAFFQRNAVRRHPACIGSERTAR
jgi:hypothetical protein